MCMSSPKMPAPTEMPAPPPPAPPAPEAPPKPPTVDADKKSVKSQGEQKRRGTSALRIDLNLPSGGSGSGLNIS